MLASHKNHIFVTQPQHNDRMLKCIYSLTTCILILITTSGEAHAWGLYSHVVFTHQYLNSLPLVSVPLLEIMRRYPSLVLAGACLPDLAVVSRTFNHSHGWGIGQQLLKSNNERHLALGIGYNIHLLTDVVAHQHFVPTFEAKWDNHSLLTHVASEWAMDAFLARTDIPYPHKLLRIHRKTIVEALSHGIQCNEIMTEHALRTLAIADQALRISRIPQWLLHRSQKLDSEFVLKLGYYRTQVTLALQDLPQLLNGHFPSLHAEHINLGIEKLEDWRRKCLQDARMHPARAIHAFEHYQHQWLNQTDT